jgi:hypothetical protein
MHQHPSEWEPDPTQEDIALLSELGLLQGWPGYWREKYGLSGWSRWRVSLIVPRHGPLSGLCRETLKVQLLHLSPDLGAELDTVESTPFGGVSAAGQCYLDFTLWWGGEGSPEPIFLEHLRPEDITLYHLTT